MYGWVDGLWGYVGDECVDVLFVKKLFLWVVFLL